MVIYGRSDATLNHGGVRIGTAEIYNTVEKLNEIAEAIVIAQNWNNDVRIVLFLKLQNDHELTKHLREKGGKWIIVTSALHMPRTIALMQSRDLGNSIIFPYPTDFTSFKPKFNLKFSFNNIGRLDN